LPASTSATFTAGQPTCAVALARQASRIMSRSCDALSASLAKAKTALVLDLSGVDYISSAGLRALMIVHKAAKAADKGLGIAGVAMIVLGVLPPILDRLRIDGALVPLAISLAVLFGIGLGAVLIPCLTMIQEATEEATRGKIFGGAFLAINLAIAVPLLLAGAIADVVGASDVVGALGVALIGTGFVAFRQRWGLASTG